MTAAAYQAAPAFFERLVQAHPRPTKRRNQTEEHPSEQRRRKCEGQHPAVDADVLQARNVPRIQPRSPSRLQMRSPNDRAAHHRQHHALGQKLPYHAHGQRREPCESHLLFTADRARKQQIGQRCRRRSEARSQLLPTTNSASRTSPTPFVQATALTKG